MPRRVRWFGVPSVYGSIFCGGGKYFRRQELEELRWIRRLELKLEFAGGHGEKEGKSGAWWSFSLLR